MNGNGWMRLELRYLAALEAIDATGSFGRAADQLGYTQSAISHQIAALERLVGEPLSREAALSWRRRLRSAA